MDGLEEKAEAGDIDSQYRFALELLASATRMENEFSSEESMQGYQAEQLAAYFQGNCELAARNREMALLWLQRAARGGHLGAVEKLRTATTEELLALCEKQRLVYLVALEALGMSGVREYDSIVDDVHSGQIASYESLAKYGIVAPAMTETEAEWVACQNPERLLDISTRTASPAALRRFACACCRRLLERFPDDWAIRVFREETDYPGGYVSPNHWPGPLLRDAIRVAEAFCSSAGCLEELRSIHAAAALAADECEGGWRQANHQLGDNASGAEEEVGFVAWHVASAVRDCCSEDIQGAVGSCLKNAMEALGRYLDEEGRAVGLDAAMVELIRKTIPFVAVEVEKEAEAIHASVGDTEAVATGWSGRAQALQSQGDLRGALALLKDAERVFEQCGLTLNLASVLANQVRVYVDLKLFDAAVEASRRAEDIYRKEGNDEALGSVLNNAAILADDAGSAADVALAAWRESERVNRRVGSREGRERLGMALGRQAQLLEIQGVYVDAARRYREAAAILIVITRTQDAVECLKGHFRCALRVVKTETDHAAAAATYGEMASSARTLLETPDLCVHSQEFVGAVESCLGEQARCLAAIRKLACVHCGGTEDPCLGYPETNLTYETNATSESRGRRFTFAQCKRCAESSKNTADFEFHGHFELRCMVGSYPQAQRDRALVTEDPA